MFECEDRPFMSGLAMILILTVSGLGDSRLMNDTLSWRTSAWKERLLINIVLQQPAVLYLVVMLLGSVQRAVVIDTDGCDVISLGGVRHDGDVGHMALSV